MLMTQSHVLPWLGAERWNFVQKQEETGLRSGNILDFSKGLAHAPFRAFVYTVKHQDLS